MPRKRKPQQATTPINSVTRKNDPELWMIVISLVIAFAFVVLMGFACAADVAYYQEHGVWWGTPPPKN